MKTGKFDFKNGY